MESRNNDRIEKISKGRFMISAAAASGDAAVCCELPGGSIAFILSDGMGKGDRAAEESRIVITRLRKMLKDGAKAAAAHQDFEPLYDREERQRGKLRYSRSHDNRQDYGES